MKVCSQPGCPELQAESRCPTHRREREQARGSRQQRGYDAAHDAARRHLLETIARSPTCWRCGTTLEATTVTLGHCDDDRSVYHGGECPPCQYATAGRTRCPHPSHGHPPAAA